MAKKRGKEPLPERLTVGIRGLEGSGIESAGVVVDVEAWSRAIADVLGEPPEEEGMRTAIAVLEAVPGLKVERARGVIPRFEEVPDPRGRDGVG